MSKLIGIVRAAYPKKFKAVFQTDMGRQKTIQFGSAGMDDYLHTHDKAQRERYRTRHRKDLETAASKTGLSAGALSWYILWGESTDFDTNLRYYKNHFGL
jgi:hypothetical protein